MTIEEEPLVINENRSAGRRRAGQTVIRKGRHPLEIAKRTDAQCRAWAVEIAADMEQGYYVDLEGHQWERRPFVIAQILRQMGYTESVSVKPAARPQWWPGTTALRRMVALKVMLHEVQAKSGSSGMPWLDPMLAMVTERILDVLYSGADVNFRELVDLTTKLARLREQHRSSALTGAPATQSLPGGGSVALQRVTETIMLSDDAEERARQTELLQRASAVAMAQLGTGPVADE